MSPRTRMLSAVVCAVAVASVYAAQPMLGAMGRDLSVPRSALGWLVSIGQLGYLAGLVLLVPLGDLFSRRHLIALHLALIALGSLTLALAPVAWVALGGLTLCGLFAVVVQTTVAYAASMSDPGERGRNLGFVTSGVIVGILGSRLLAGALSGLWGWRSVYFLLAALTASLGIATLLLLPTDVRSPSGRYADVLRGMFASFTDPVLLSRGAIAFFVFASFGTLWSGMALPLSAAPWHLSEAQIGLFGLAGLAGALGATRAGRWADAGHGGRVSGIALAILVAAWTLIGQLHRSLALLSVGVLALDLAVQAVHVSNQHLLTTRRVDRASTTVGAYMVFYSLGSALGAAATTAAYAAAGWTGSALLGAAFAAAAFLAWALGAAAARTATAPACAR